MRPPGDFPEATAGKPTFVACDMQSIPSRIAWISQKTNDSPGSGTIIAPVFTALASSRFKDFWKE